jgi:unsaturated chondroitin disaccharide hydrolase
MKPIHAVLNALLAMAAPPAVAQPILHVDFLAVNPGATDYEGVVWIPASEISSLLPGFDGLSFLVTTTNSPDIARDHVERRAYELPSQALDEDGNGTPERIGVHLALTAGEKKVITLHSGALEQIARLKGRYRTMVAAARIPGGGAAIWESERVAYTWRKEGGIIVPAAKPSVQPITTRIPVAQLLRMRDAVFTAPHQSGVNAQGEVISAGPIAAAVRVAGSGGDLVYVIGRGSRWTFVRARLQGQLGTPQAGIAKREREVLLSGDGWIATLAGEPAVALAVYTPPEYAVAGSVQQGPRAGGPQHVLRLRPGSDGRVEYAFAAYFSRELQENVVEPSETEARLPEVPGAERYGSPSSRILLRPPPRDAEAIRKEIAADVRVLANPPQVRRLSSKAVTYSGLLPPEALRASRKKDYDEALQLMIRRLRSLMEASGGKFWFSSDVSGKPDYRNNSWGEGYLVSMLWDGFRITGDIWYKSAALAANERMLGGEERELHATGLNYWNASVRSFRETGEARWRASGLKCADMTARIADPVTGFVPEYGPALRQKPGDPYHRSNYVKIDALVGVPILWWAFEETKDRRYLDAANRHFTSTVKTLIEPDGAALQMLWQKPGSPQILGIATNQGYGGNSRWARGLAWVLDGYPDAYRTTKDPAYRTVFERSAKWLEANLPGDLVPWYDFDDQAVFWRYRDSSTSAISAYGLLRMAALEPDAALARFYERLGTRIVDSLIDNYLTPVGPDDSRPAGMLAHACYTKPVEGEFIWGSYSLLRSLCLLKERGAARPK